MSQGEFIELWSSPFLIAPLPDCEQPNQRLSELALSHSCEGVFGIDDPAVDWLRIQLSHGISQYLSVANIISEVNWHIRARFEILARGDYRPLSNSPGRYLGGLYIIRAPEQLKEAMARDDLKPGTISFYDPRVGMNMNAIRDDPYIICEQTLNPEPGLLILWPGFVKHFVHPIHTREPAIRVSFDVELKAPGKSTR